MITAREIVETLGPLLREHRPGRVSRFRRPAIDSRQTGRGDLFVALTGEHADGHEFVPDAVAKGARGVLVQRAPGTLSPEVAVFAVPDALAALQRLAAGRRERRRARVVGVTGSVGKTMTKELIAAVLESKHEVLKSEGNYNTEIGLPLMLLELTRRQRRAVLEMAMRAPGEIRTLCEIARPDVGVVTNVGPSHMDQLGSLEAIAAAKAELVDSLPEAGVAVLNADDPLVRGMAERTSARVVLYGTSPDPEVRATDVASRGLDGVTFTLRWRDAHATVRLPVPGRHNVANALAAAAVGLDDGMSVDEVAEALGRAQVEMRIRSLQGRGGSTLVDDAYNASPASMTAALDLLAEMEGRRIAVLGDMKELGTAEEEGHQSVGRHAARVADVIHTVGELGGVIAAAAREAGHRETCEWPSKEAAAKALSADLGPNDVVLVKASRAMAFETLVEELKED